MEFELWLDESGTFFKNDNNAASSFIGGLLLEKSKVDSIDYDIIDPDKTHANELTEEDKQEYLLPILEYLKDEGAIEVFFENTENEDHLDGRDLYLHMMAEGLLQLLQQLDAEYESVQLEVLIAAKVDEKFGGNIAMEAYRRAFTEYLQEKKNKNILYYHEQTRLQFKLLQADTNNRLQLADFACYVRHARNFDYYWDYQDRIDSLYENALFFPFSTRDADNYILRSLADGNIADAVIELYSSPNRYTESWRTEHLMLIIDNIKNNGHRYVLNQLDQIVSTIETRLLHEDDYEYGEELCRELLKKNSFLDLFLSGTEAYKSIRLAINLKLSEMYINEGDIISAANTLKECGNIYSEMNDTLEHISCYYDLQLILAEYELASFQASKAVERMERMIGELDRQMHVFANLSENSALNGVRKSIYKGKALSMKLKALMAAQQINDYSIDEVVSLFTEAESHLSGDETELEKLDQLRCYFEQSYADNRYAMEWLLKAKYGEAQETYEIDETIVQQFLADLVATDDEMNCKNYLFYYLSVVETAVARDEELATDLFEAVGDNDTFLHIVNPGQQQQTINSVNLNRVQKKTSARLYHPMELICWKTGKILYKLFDKEAYNNIRGYYKEAIDLCYRYEEYHAMQITGLGIRADYIRILSDLGLHELAGKEIKTLEQNIKGLRSIPFDQETKSFLQQIEELASAKRFAEISERILTNRF